MNHILYITEPTRNWVIIEIFVGNVLSQTDNPILTRWSVSCMQTFVSHCGPFVTEPSQLNMVQANLTPDLLSQNPHNWIWSRLFWLMTFCHRTPTIEHGPGYFDSWPSSIIPLILCHNKIHNRMVQFDIDHSTPQLCIPQPVAKCDLQST